MESMCYRLPKRYECDSYEEMMAYISKTIIDEFFFRRQDSWGGYDHTFTWHVICGDNGSGDKNDEIPLIYGYVLESLNHDGWTRHFEVFW